MNWTLGILLIFLIVVSAIYNVYKAIQITKGVGPKS